MMKWTAVDGISSAYIRTMQTACITTLLVACFYANSAAANSISPLFTHNLAYQSADAYTRPPVRIVAHPGPYICSDLNGSYYGESYNTFWKRWDVTCVDSPNYPPGTTYGGGFYSEIRECPPGYALWGSLCQPNDTPQELGKDKGRPSECAGNPVDLSTGRKYQVQVDYENPINPLLRFERIYSLYAYTSDYEPKNIFNAASFPLDPFKWSHTYSRYLKFFTSNTTGETEYVSAHRHDFSVLRFDRDPQTGEWKSPFPDVTEVIRKIDVGGEMQWEYVATSGAVETYDSEGRLVRMADHGKSVDLQHTDSSLTVTDNFGRTLIIHHGGPNDTLIQSLTLPGGESVAYSYVTVDNKKRLDSVTYADGTGFRYQYTTGLSAILDLNGVELSSWQYDSAWPTRVVQSLKGGVEDYSFAYSSGFEQPTIEPVPTVTVTSPSGKGTTYAFEYVQGERKLVRVDGLPSANCLATTRSITYDQDGNIASRTDNEGNVTNFVRDTLGRVIQRTDAVGMASERTVAVTWDGTHEWPATISDGIVQRANIYDANGNILSTTLTDLGTGASKQWTMTYNGDGQVLTLDGPRTDVADTTSYAYDGSGNLASVTDANGKVTLYSGHNAHGQPQTVEDPNGRVTSIAYDARQRVASLVADGVTTTLSYDLLGNLLGVTRSTGTSFTYQYDSARRLVSVTNAIGHRWELVRDSASGDIVSIRFVDDVGAVGFVKNLANDELGRVIAISDSLGNSSTFSYNLNGNLIETTDALSRSSASSYDALNRLIGIVDPAQGEITFAFDSRDNLVAVSDPRGNTTTYAHNGFDEKISQVSPETGTTAYVFDDAGNVVGMTDARGIAVDYAYDVLNWLISASYPDPNLDATFAYDAGPHGIGHLSSVQDAAGVTTYSYDIRGNLLSESRTGNTGVKTVTSYHYDAEGRLIGMTYPSGREVNYTLDLAGNVVQINTLFDGQTDNLADNIQHLPFGPMTALDYGNGLSLSRAFDQTYRLLNQSIVRAGPV